VFGWTRRVTLARVTPEDSTPLNWDTTRAEPLGPPAAPVSGPVVPYQPQPQYFPPVAPPPYPTQVYVQPVARKGITGPQAAILITVLVLVLPVLCCLGAMVIGMIGGGADTGTTTP
jgi:hypothetical protein